MASHQAPVLEISNLRIKRGGIVILDDVSWRVERNQHWAILGANGSGKTSLLSALTGYLMPSAGRITALGKQYGRTDWRELRKRIGIVGSTIRQMMADFEPALASVVSGKHAMIDFWGRITPRDRARARKILAQVECSHLEERPWLYLSQGERQRVLIGRALMANPKLLILDEPCAGLDPVAREHFLDFLERLARTRHGPTLVLVTHHVEEIMPRFSHVLALRAGRVVYAKDKRMALRSAELSKVFNLPVRVQKSGGRYTMKVAPASGRIT